MHEVNPSVWPEDRYANIPPTRLYNTDEQGPNPTQLRNPVLVPASMVQERSRIFQNTREGDGKMPFQYSVANVVRADGAQSHPDAGVEGAPPPYILISDASSTNDLDTMDKAERDKALANQSEADEIQINPAIYEGWFDEFEVGEKDEKVNPLVSCCEPPHLGVCLSEHSSTSSCISSGTFHTTKDQGDMV